LIELIPGRSAREDGDLNGGDEIACGNMGDIAAIAAASRAKSEDLPPPESPAAAKEANVK
jgi:hypothetical protein